MMKCSVGMDNNLVLAALVCSFVWGLAYRLWPKQLFALIVSHAVWDTLVFVVWPI